MSISKVASRFYNVRVQPDKCEIYVKSETSTTMFANLVTKTTAHKYYFDCKVGDQDKNGQLIFAAILATLSCFGGLLVSERRCLLQFP